MPEITLTAGTVEYEDTGGEGPVLVFLHGLIMNGSVWRHIVSDLRLDYRCVLPTLPLGGHRLPMYADADLSLPAMSLLVGEFFSALDLTDVTVVQNDWGGVQILIAIGDSRRITRLVLTSCEAFDNYPPRPVRAIALAARMPGGLAAMMQFLRLRLVRRAPRSWGWMSKRPVPTEIMDAWFQPATTDPRIRRDLAKYVTSVPAPPVLLQWADRATTFGGPVLVAWATEDKMMPLRHGHRLASAFPKGRLVEIDDSYTLLPEDQPVQLAQVMRDFLSATDLDSPDR